MNTTNNIAEAQLEGTVQPQMSVSAAPGPRGSSLAPSDKITNLQSSIINHQSLVAPSPKPNRVIDTWCIPFPKTLDELAALDAARETPYLKALCNRRFIHTPGKNPTPQQIIPIIEQILTAHRAKQPKTLSPYADIFVEWKLIRGDLEEFLTNLRSLIPQKIENPQPSIANHKSTPTISPISLIGPIPQSTIPDPKSPKTPRHFHVSNAEPSKTHAISTPPPASPKTLGHFHDSPQKNSLEEPATSSPSSFPSLPSVKSEPISQTSPAKKSPRIQPLLSTLSPETKELIIAFCEETDSYKQAAQKIHQHLGIKLSVKSLCKLYTTHNIAEDQQTREEIEAAANSQNQTHKPKDIRAIARDQLELRLLELSTRRDHDTSQLKELFQIITRLEALALSERRVIVAEKREARMNTTQQPQPRTPQVVSQNEMIHYVKGLLGKEITIADDLLTDSRGRRGDEALTDSASDTPSNPSLQAAETGHLLTQRPVRAPSPRGPHFASANVDSGQPTRGGLGKPLGRGEGPIEPTAADPTKIALTDPANPT